MTFAAPMLADVRSIAVAALLSAGVAAAILCCFAMASLPDALSRIHLSSAVTIVSGPLIVIAVWLADSGGQARIKATLIAALLFALNAVLTHATAKAIRIRQAGNWEIEGSGGREEDEPREAGAGAEDRA